MGGRHRSNHKRQAIIAFFTAAVVAGIAAVISNTVQDAPSKIKDAVVPAHQSKPIVFNVQADQSNCQTFLFPGKTIQDIGNPPSNGNFAEWARSAGAADANPYTKSVEKVMITIRGTTSSQVLVTGLTFTKVNTVVGGKGGVAVANQCGGPTEARYAEVNLDTSPPSIVSSSAKSVEWGNTQEAVTPLRFPYVVADNELEALLIIAETSNYTEWEGELAWTDGNQKGVEKITLNGKPFRTTTIVKGTPLYSFDPEEHKWIAL